MGMKVATPLGNLIDHFCISVLDWHLLIFLLVNSVEMSILIANSACRYSNCRVLCFTIQNSDPTTISHGFCKRGSPSHTLLQAGSGVLVAQRKNN